MSADVIPMPRPALPRSVPVGAAAYALAELNGVQWADMTASDLRVYEQLAVFAAALVNPETRLDFCYVIESERVLAEHGPDSLADLSPRERRQRAFRTMAGLRFAWEAAAGMHADRLAVAALQASHDAKEHQR
jgi:hypothetical protein